MDLNFFDNSVCSCGKHHVSDIKGVITGKNAINSLPGELKKLGAEKVFLMSDINTNRVTGDKVRILLAENGFTFKNHCFKEIHLIPDERSVGNAFMHFDKECNAIITIGSGVLNDIGKILSKVCGIPCVIIATAPSMDGYASDSSSMELDGVKISLLSKSPDIIIGDTDILKTAPDKMLKAGLGDMLAKYIGVCEWRISHEINDEYYCEKIAGLVRDALFKCVSDPEGLLSREDSAIENVFCGLILSGLTMKYAGVSRPASGIEHYFSHVWDMRSLEKGTNADLHGIQCAIGTLYSLRLYEKLSLITPDKNQALEYVQNFNYDSWCDTLRNFLGRSAETLISLEKTENKYDTKKHRKRLEVIMQKWDIILDIIKEELPPADKIEFLMKSLDMPVGCENIGISNDILHTTFKVTKDIRNKYILSHLAWDLGILDELCEVLK